MNLKNLDFEEGFWKRNLLIAGTDEAGRGALAGPIAVAIVILPIGFKNPLIQDSKILSPQKRKKIYRIIKQVAVEYKVIWRNAREIEEKNPLRATKEAMAESILNLKNKPDLTLVDGKEKIELEKFKTLSLIGGDRKSINIAAASIIAKVSRDNLMEKLHRKYPVYNWQKNKGYPNKIHFLALARYGICDLHRKSYEPIKSLLNPDCKREEIWVKYKLKII